MQKIILSLLVIVTFSSCYEYRKLPNTKRVTKRDVRRAMKHSSWQYTSPKLTMGVKPITYYNK